jgi:hypothetical protein
MYILCSGFELYDNILKSGKRATTNRGFHISYVKEGEFVMAEWINESAYSEYKEGLKEVLLKIKESKAKRLVSVVRMLKEIEPEDKKWEVDVWFPQVLDLSLDKIAIVTSEHLYNKQVVENIMKGSKFQVLVFGCFIETEKAVQWVKS